jgi:2-amino-4-hydroxy-6-hydroxymethyldihydropteridine diphosphokinase
MKNSVFLLIGGNLGDRFKLLDQAKTDIQKEIGQIQKESSIYETAAWGFESKNDFLNQVIMITTDFEAIEVLKLCQEIENKLGRTRESDQYASRTMDIDILFFNDEIIDLPDLKIPHIQLHKRKFTLEPLSEIAPEFIHPSLNKTMKELLQDCSDKSMVKIVKVDA